MSTSYSTAVGSPPSIENYPAWKAWYDGLLAFRQAECPVVRATTYYIGQDGAGNSSGGGGAGTEADPWLCATWDDAVTLIGNEIASDTAFLLRRGDTFTGTSHLGVNQANVTIGTYGSGDKPLINKFTLPYSGGWTLVSGTVYNRTEASDVAWVRRVADRLDSPISRASDATGTGGIAGNWFFWNASTLTVDIGVDPNTVDLEAVVTDATANLGGVTVFADGCRVDNIRADGWGMSRTSTSTQGEGIKSRVGGTDACVFSDCESYYCSSHAMAHLKPDGAGGIWTAINCKAGYTKFNGVAYETVFNSYAASGGHETILHNCETTYGTLPSSDWHTVNAGVRGTSYYGHTGGTAASIYIACGHTSPDKAFGPGRPGYWGDAATAATLSNVRSFCVGDDFRQSRVGGDFYSMGPGQTVRMNSFVRMLPGRLNQRALSNVNQFGWVINFDWRFDLINWPSNFGDGIALWNATTSASTVQFIHGLIEIVPSPNAGIRFPDWDGGTGSNGVKFSNVIINIGATPTGSSVINGITADGDHFDHCAWFGDIAASAITGGDQVQLSDATVSGERPNADSDLYEAGTATDVVYDFERHVFRDPPSIGPLERPPLAGASGHAFGFSNDWGYQ